MLYVVATPLGNLSDITPRALEALSLSDYILCEDTRHSQRLLAHYQIRKPCYSLHKFNEKAQLERVISDLQKGLKVALISDAGTPAISDPGQLLVDSILDRQLKVSPLPGPCAAIAALSSSGLSSERFQFCGFLSRKAGELNRQCLELLGYPGTSICYESPRRLAVTLGILAKLEPLRRLVIARELTKIHEEILRGTAVEIYEKLAEREIKGEIVLLIAPPDGAALGADWETLAPAEHVAQIEKTYQLSRMEAIKMAAKLRGVPKKEIYQKTLQDNSMV